MHRAANRDVVYQGKLVLEGGLPHFGLPRLCHTRQSAFILQSFHIFSSLGAAQ